LNRVCNGIIAFEGDGRVTVTPGNYDYYLEKRREREARAAAPPVKPPAAPVAPRTKARKLTFKEQRELEGMEAVIQAAEAEVARLEARLASPEFFRTQGAQVQAVMQELEQARQAVARRYARWEELETLRAAASAA
jgi:ATP-binding cassette subfamily F protein uup